MNELYDEIFCIEQLKEFQLDRFELIEIDTVQKELLKFNKENDANVNSLISLNMDIHEDQLFLINDKDTKNIYWTLDNIVHVYQDKAIIILKNIEKNLRYAINLSERNKLFLFLG